LNRTVMRAGLSPALLSLIVAALATCVFVWAGLGAGLSRRRGALLAGVLLGSPVLLETVNFWSGTLNYTLVLLLVSLQLRAGAWARRATATPSQGVAGELSRGLLVTGGGALLALLTYEIALPFVLASVAFYVGGWARRAAAVGLASVALIAFVAALAAAGLYWPQRFNAAAERLTSTVSGTASRANHPADGNSAAQANANDRAGASADAGQLPASGSQASGSLVSESSESLASPASALPVSAPHASASERARMYVSLLFSFIRTGLQSSPWLWTLVLALSGMSFLARRAAGEPAGEGRLPWSVAACAFACALVACVGYLALTKSMNARYAAFLLIYGAATLAWTKGRAAVCALTALLLVQAAVAASLPVHLRDVERAARGAAQFSAIPRAGDLVSIDGRLARASWGKRFLAPPSADALTRPLSPRACRYLVPCEECK
jgi:hypothetical protein